MTRKISALFACPFLVLSWILCCLILPQEICGQNLRAINVVLDQEKRSCIQAVDGYAYLSENMSLAQTRAAAFANAKRQALEMAKTYIRSKTMVEDFEVKYDLVWATAEGAITILEQKDYGVEDNSRYHVWIKAEVEYELSPKGQQPSQGDQGHDMDTGLPLKVKVWTSKKAYGSGENIEIYIQGNRDFYARIVDITSNGEIIQLLPNDYRRINFFEAGKVYKIPDEGDHFDLKVTAPYGEDKIVVYASEVPLGQVTMEGVGQGLSRYRGSRESLAVMTRGIKVVPGAPGSQSGAEFYEATWTLTTSK
ncbi:MAG: DUF4384 domain-containing protein [Deltaproteobacteria bacterium]|nr:DUF4384 domain-containing protein [Deltaproteobacteria bacterium]MBW2073322.1 DUF4384 domain-containing protein [Deltaproteobacteria bacterium]